MLDPISFLTALVCAAICARIVAFRRGAARYRPGISALAYILAASSGCQALAVIFGLHLVQSPFVLVILIVLLALVWRARGNVANILRVEWDGVERRKEVR